MTTAIDIVAIDVAPRDFAGLSPGHAVAWFSLDGRTAGEILAAYRARVERMKLALRMATAGAARARGGA